jgi:hypothetical protein
VNKLTDWRGLPIEVGTVVLYTGGNRWADWKIGRVTEIREPNIYGQVLLNVDWYEESSPNFVQPSRGRGVSPEKVMVWPG